MFYSKEPLKIDEQPTEMPTKIPVNTDLRGHSYELIDFGSGRKLELFAGLVLDRPCPAAEGSKRMRVSSWKQSDLVFRSDAKSGWSTSKSEEEPSQGWLFRWKTLAMELRASSFGHVGLFPEQISNWRWLQSLSSSLGRKSPLKAINLFGYTGGSSLALAASGWQVTHVDASRPTIQWARKNAQLSHLESAPIRWIIDDVRDFVSREAKRGEKYDLVIMDPPAYGHGKDGQDWSLERDLEGLIDNCIKLSQPKSCMLITGHSPIPSIEKGPFTDRTWKRFAKIFSQNSKHSVSLIDSSQRKLDFGYTYRFWN